MIFISYELETETKAKVILKHYDPRQLDADILEKGILVDTIPQEDNIVGKSPILYVNPKTKELWYEYIDIPKTEEELQQNEIATLKQQIQQQNQAISDLTMMIAMSQTPQL